MIGNLYDAEVRTIDIVTYALCKKVAAGAVSGIANLEVQGTDLVITTTSGQELVMNFPTPAQGVSVTDIQINSNNELICSMSDGNEINAGKIPQSPIPIASAETIGGIKVGKNLKIEEDGTLNAIGGTGSSSDYELLENKPTLNGVEISGAKTSADYGIKEDQTFVFSQEDPVQEWVIQHDMGKYPMVMVVDENKYQVWSEIQFIDLNTIKINFSSGFTGYAFLN